MTTPINSGTKNIVSPVQESMNAPLTSNEKKRAYKKTISKSTSLAFQKVKSKKVSANNIGNVLISLINNDMSTRSEMKYRCSRGLPWSMHYKEWTFDFRNGLALAVYAPRGHDSIAVDFCFDEKGNLVVGCGFILPEIEKEKNV